MNLPANVDAATLFADREADRYALHTRHLNEQMVRVLRTIGYDVGFVRGQGQYLYDRNGAQYLDLLSGFGVFALRRGRSQAVRAGFWLASLASFAYIVSVALTRDPRGLLIWAGG